MDETDKIYQLPSCQVKPDKFLFYPDSFRKLKVPLIIDNGSYQCKAGWATDENPAFVFKNHLIKTRGKKENEIHVGNDIKNIEAVRWLLKTQFDRNVVTQFDIQETIFDHIFNHLGINSNGHIDHPVVITEPVCNPSYSRQYMSELLFECYKVPQVVYGIDSLFSFYKHNLENKVIGESGLVVSLGYNTTHVLPVLSGKMNVKNAKRINIGGQNMINYLQRILQLKYPAHTASITLSRSESILHDHLYFSKNYSEDIKKWANEDFYNENMHKIQLPYIPMPGSSDSPVNKLEKCHALLRRVQASRHKKRAEKLAFDEELLQEYMSVKDMIEDEEAVLALQELGFTSTTELEAGIKKLNCNIRKTKNLIASQQDEPQDSPLRDWCEELNLENFSDIDTWFNFVKHKREEVFEAHQRLSSDKMKSTHIGGFSSTTVNDLFGGIFCDPVEVRSFQEYTNDLEEKKEQVKILDEILAEYEREFSKSEQNFSFNLAEYYQLHVGQERIRVPEIVFQPSMIGVEQAGIPETIEYILARYSANDQQKLCENVFITGGCAKLPNLRERLEAELRSIRPFKSKLNVYIADDPHLDAWKGARKWALAGDNLSKYSIKRSQYEEKGGDYLMQHSCSNNFVPIPAPIRKGILTTDSAASIKS